MSRAMWNSLREEQRQEQIAALTLERDELARRLALAEEELLARRARIDITFYVGQHDLAELIPPDERNPEAMDREEAELLARCVCVQAYRGSWQVLADTVKSRIRQHVASRRAVRGAALLERSLAEAAPEIPVRLLNSLESAGILTVGHLLALRDDLPRLQIPNVARLSLAQLAIAQRSLCERAVAPLTGEAAREARDRLRLPPVPERAVFAPRPADGQPAPAASAADEGLAEAEAAAFNGRWSVGDAVVYRGQLRTRLSGPARVEAGVAVCRLHKVAAAVPCETVTPAAPQKKRAIHRTGPLRGVEACR